MAKAKVTRSTESDRSWVWTLVKGGLAITFAFSVAFNVTNTMHISTLERAVAVAEQEALEEDDIYVYVLREEAEHAQPVVDFTEITPIHVDPTVVEPESVVVLPVGDGTVATVGVVMDSIPLWPGKWIKIRKPARSDDD